MDARIRIKRQRGFPRVPESLWQMKSLAELLTSCTMRAAVQQVILWRGVCEESKSFVCVWPAGERARAKAGGD